MKDSQEAGGSGRNCAVDRSRRALERQRNQLDQALRQAGKVRRYVTKRQLRLLKKAGVGFSPASAHAKR